MHGDSTNTSDGPRRVCTRCGRDKPETDFTIGQYTTKKGRKYRRIGVCRDCTNAWHVQNNRRPDRMRNRLIHYLKRRYGLTVQQYDAMFAAQNGVCAICGKPETIQLKDYRGHRQLSVDHCHRTGKLRSLLCRACNTGIAQFNDDPNLLAAAIAYLRRHPT